MHTLDTLGMADILSWNFMPRISAQNPGSTFLGPCEGTKGFPSAYCVPSDSTCLSRRHVFLSGLVQVVPDCGKPSHFAICFGYPAIPGIRYFDRTNKGFIASTPGNVRLRPWTAPG